MTQSMAIPLEDAQSFLQELGFEIFDKAIKGLILDSGERVANG